MGINPGHSQIPDGSATTGHPAAKMNHAIHQNSET